MSDGPEKKSANMALDVLRAISKSSNTALQLDDVPEEFLNGQDIQLGRWTLVVTDKNMKQLSDQAEKIYFLDCNKPTIPEMFWDFWTPKPGKVGVKSLEIPGTKQVTEFGLAVFARGNPGLQNLNVSGCVQIGDVGLREVGMNCPQLLSLNISGCHMIEGQGLIAIADYCKFLVKLDISKMAKLEKFGLTKIFYSCKNLEELNFDGMNIVGDQEIIVLAQNCPNVTYFNAPDCTFISDASTQLLAKMCPDLDYVDLSRASMSTRITDLTLLGFGQSSASLRVLKLSGCDQLTDVGLMWLAEGCKVLEELDLNGCQKISDAGIRSLAAHCLSLTSLDISQAKLVSDVGVANLSVGCPNLKRLVLVGLYLMCDPRNVVNVKKGAKLDAWQSIIGIQAVAQYLEGLEDIDLSGCFRLNKSIRNFLSRIGTLKKVNFTACNQMSTEALVDLAKGCVLLEDITLTDCGECVNNTSITAISKYCKKLHTFVAQRCLEIRGGAITALSKVSTLIKLDLSACKTLTDMMMLPLTEVDRVDDLKTLILVNCPLLTDTTLAWFASKTQNIQLMALKGTSITKHSVQAVRDRFPNSDKLDNTNFLGFWPKFRIEDRKIMNKYYYIKQGWIKLQARQRSWLARERVKVIVRKRQVKAAIKVLQSMVHVFVAINRVYYRRLEIARYQRKAVVVTSIFYIALAKKKVFRRKQALHDAYIYRIVCLMQTRWRMCWATMVRYEKIRLYKEWLRKRVHGATKFQSIVRVYFAKLRVLHIKQMRKARVLLIERKAIIIQRIQRGRKGRVKAVERRKYLEWFRVRRHTAAAQIQHKARIIYTNKLVRQRQAKKKLRYKSARSIQALIRGFCCRLVLAQEGAEEFEIQQDGASTIMQSCWRRKAAYILIRQKRAELETRLARIAKAAVVVQCGARAKKARRELAKRKKAYYELLKARVDMELWGVCKIQALFRGMRGRMRFDALLRERKGKWKELFDDEKKRRFFYNKLTGEIRWRMPQDLLDLIPHPKCDNCTFYEGLLECGVCNEIYCQQCFDQVHFGGRRKDHEFRTLYDFYGKRLDYGDGVFPSKWPSEVIQDEVQGWMLRVAPIRDPVCIHDNSWEEYKEIQPDGTQGKQFFFNRDSFEATYDEPPDVTAQLANQAAWAEYNAEQQRLAEQAAIDYGGFGAKPIGQVAPAGQDDGYYDTARSGMGTGRAPAPGTGRVSQMTHPPPPLAPPIDSARNPANPMMSTGGPGNRLLNTGNTSRMPPGSARGKKELADLKKGKRMTAAERRAQKEADEQQARYEENAFGTKKPSLSPDRFTSRTSRQLDTDRTLD